ncbi:MAG: hypothetical protein FD175_2789 [Beijerinckiaceae bacterium]|nr:MAG: hypothetical protein FD175_2789 [Beijerinckiaceae bacterium]
MNDQQDDAPITLKKKKVTGQFDPSAVAALARPEAGSQQFAEPAIASSTAASAAGTADAAIPESRANLVNVTFKTDRRVRDEFMIYCRRQGVSAQSLLEAFVTEKAKLSNS